MVLASTLSLDAVHLKSRAATCFSMASDTAPSAGHKPAGGAPNRRVWLSMASAMCNPTRAAPPGYSVATGSGEPGNVSSADRKLMSSGANG